MDPGAAASCNRFPGGAATGKEEPDVNKRRTILGSSAAVLAVMLCSRVLGFLRQTMIANVFGASAGTDIYFISSEFAISVAGALSSALTTALVTVYIAVAAKEDRKSAGSLASKVLTLFLLMAAVLALLMSLFAPQIGMALAPKYDDPALRGELAKYLRLFSVTFLFSAFQSIYAAVLNANDIFVPGKLYGVVFNPIAIFAILVLGDRLGVLSLVYAYYGANILQMVLLYLRARKIYAFRPSLNLRDTHLRQVGYLALPILLSNIVIQFNGVIDKAICSYLGVGVASNYTYASTLEQFVTGTFTATIALVLLSRFAESAAKKDSGSMEALLKTATASMLLILAPVSLITVLCSGDIVSLVYLRGRFTVQDVRTTAMAISGFAVGFPLVALREIMKKTRRPMVISTAAVLLNGVLSVALARPLGVFGVAFATSTAAALTTWLLVRSVKEELPEYRFFALGGTMRKCILALALCGLSVWGLGEVLPDAALARVVVRILGGCAVYGLALLALRCREVLDLLALAKERLGKS